MSAAVLRLFEDGSKNERYESTSVRTVRTSRKLSSVSSSVHDETWIDRRGICESFVYDSTSAQPMQPELSVSWQALHVKHWKQWLAKACHLYVFSCYTVPTELNSVMRWRIVYVYINIYIYIYIHIYIYIYTSVTREMSPGSNDWT